MSIKFINSFTEFTELSFQKREINTVEEKITRKDWAYDILARNFYYADKQKKDKLLIFAKVFERYTDTSSLSKASYIYALHYNWEKAISLM